MAYNVSPNRITGLSPFKIVFGRPPPLPLPNPEAHFPQPTAQHLFDHFLALKAGLRNIREQVYHKLEARKEQIRRSYDYMRRPLDITPGDYAYVYYPHTDKRFKLHPRAFGPYPVVGVHYQWGTGNVTGVTLNLGTDERPNHKRFARNRIHPFTYAHRNTN